MQMTVVHYLAAMLQAFGIKRLVASPGTQNAYFNLLLQQNPFFTCKSVVDERSAAYAASGWADECGEPVLITCTEATASRNYLSALTECYYRRIPVIAITFYNPFGSALALSPQHIDRSFGPLDCAYLHVELPVIKTPVDRIICQERINEALITAKYQRVPVHINVPSVCDWPTLQDRSLPQDFSTTVCLNATELGRVDWRSLKDRNFALFIGAHPRFAPQTLELIGQFVEKHGIPVLCEHNSNYNGPNRVLTTVFSALLSLNATLLPHVILDLGGICADYLADVIFQQANTMLLPADGKYHCRQHRIPQVMFAMSETEFFARMLQLPEFPCDSTYFGRIAQARAGVVMPKLPLSTPLVCELLSQKLQRPCSVHFSILNAYRMANCFDFAHGVTVSCNTGGFGIDGAVSAAVGHSWSDPQRLTIAVTGDLAFYYDMSMIGNRDIGPNFRIIVINNSGGEEFRLNYNLLQQAQSQVEPLVAAANHCAGGFKGWAKSCGFVYRQAADVPTLEKEITNLCTQEFERPVFLEVLTTDAAEREAYSKLLMQHLKFA